VDYVHFVDSVHSVTVHSVTGQFLSECSVAPMIDLAAKKLTEYAKHVQQTVPAVAPSPRLFQGNQRQSPPLNPSSSAFLCTAAVTAS
jgi:hypothetical protein